MSDKRFVKDHSYLVNYGRYCILDKVQHKHLCLDEVCNKLNEQQATINELQAQLREKEREERLYAKEILELRETNKEHIKFKSLGGDY